MSYMIKNKFYLVLLCFLGSTTIHAQWAQQISGTTEGLNAVYFPAIDTGYTVGANGVILKTTDGGTNWVGQQQATLSGGIFLSVFFTDANTGYVGGEGGIIKTTDGGNSWVLLSDTIVPHSIYFTNRDTGYVVGAPNYIGVLAPIYKTTNGGANWVKQTNGTTSSYAFTSVFFPAIDTGYIASNGGILKTTNGGTNWALLPSSSIYNSFNSVYFLNSGTGYAVTGYKIIKTTDGGTTWADYVCPHNISLNSVYFTDADTGYAVGDSINSNLTPCAVILKTTDGGVTWVKQITGVVGGELASVFFTKNNAGYAVARDGTILKTPIDENIGISKKELNNLKMVLWPNPTLNNIQVTSNNNQILQLQVTDVLGNELIRAIMQQSKVNIDVSTFQSGVYFIKTIQGTQKFIKE